MLTFGSLFAGIGGFDLGFERAGMKCRWQVEIDPYCQKVLAKHWPDVGRWDDVRTFPPAPAEDWAVDVICGGFPCQDISNAGNCEGIGGPRSGLWREFARTVREIRPRFVVVENVAALAGRGLDRVLGDFSSCGYDAEWDCLPAGAFGAEHFRDRMFVVAYPMQPGFQMGRASREDGRYERIFGQGLGFACGTESPGLERRGEARWRGDVHGIPRRMDRVERLGNAVVPQIAEWLGLRIIETSQSGRPRLESR